MRDSVDVLVITALVEEYDAVRRVLGPGWKEHGAGGSEPHATTTHGGMSVALARPVTMGGRSTIPIATALTDRLRPDCLAMTGVCAGRPGHSAPGDVIVASPAYQWDEGKQLDGVFLPDNQQFPLDSRWVREVQQFKPDGLPSYGTASDDEAKIWYLERLLKGQEPRKHPARDRYFPPATWPARLARWESEGLIAWQAGDLTLTAAGRTLIERTLYFDVDSPKRLPFKVMPGPMASGNAVMTDAKIWARLETGQRHILAVDMEGAAIATVANERRVPHWLVAKGVMDHANADKDDRFKEFAARASAEVLFALLGTLLTPAPARPERAVPDQIRAEVVRGLPYDWQDLADDLGIPLPERRRFRAGDEPHEVLAWLAARGRLAELPLALQGIGRGDLAALLRPYV